MSIPILFARGLIHIGLIGALAAMLGAQVWGFLRLSKGFRFLPEASPSFARWGVGSIASIFFGYVLVQTIIRDSYLILRDWNLVKTTREAPHKPLPQPQEAVRKGSDVVTAKESLGAEKVRPDGPPKLLSFAEIIAIGSLTNLLAIVLVPLLLRTTVGTTISDLGVSFEHAGADVATGALTFLLVTPWIYAVNFLAGTVFSRNVHPLEDMLRTQATPGVVALAVVSAVALAPVAEELLFRGVLLGWLNRIFGDKVRTNPQPYDLPDQTLGEERPRPLHRGPTLPTAPRATPKGATSALVASSLPFALLHLGQMPAPFAIFFLSLTLGHLAQRTGRLLPSMTLHALFNGLSTLALIDAILRPPTQP